MTFTPGTLYGNLYPYRTAGLHRTGLASYRAVSEYRTA